MYNTEIISSFKKFQQKMQKSGFHLQSLHLCCVFFFVHTLSTFFVRTPCFSKEEQSLLVRLHFLQEELFWMKGTGPAWAARGSHWGRSWLLVAGWVMDREQHAPELVPVPSCPHPLPHPYFPDFSSGTRGNLWCAFLFLYLSYLKN